MGSGPKRKALTEKISAGKSAPIIELPDAPELEGVDMPSIKDYMKARQKNGMELCAEEIFKETWEWLKKVGCTEYVNVQLINQYAMSVARQIQCEQCISDYGLLAKHPTTVMQSHHRMSRCCSNLPNRQINPGFRFTRL